MEFSEGDEVLAKHPNFDEYCKGKILSMRGDRYRVQFDADTEYTVRSTDIKISRPSRSSTRGRAKGKKSPSRTSPSRRSPRKHSPARSASGSRKSISRGRLPKVFLPRIELDIDTPVEKKVVSAVSTVDDIESIPLQSRLKDTGVVSRRSTRLFSGTLKPESEHKMVMLTRNINRAVSLPLERKNQLHDFGIDGKERGHSVQKDHNLLKTTNYEEDVKTEINTEITEKRKKEISMVSEPQEWGGWFGTFILIFLTPLITVLPQLMCTQKQCKFGYPEIPTDLNSFISMRIFTAYLGFFLFVVIISMIPIGKKVAGPQSRIGRLQYRLNGFLCALLSLIIFITCVYKEFEITEVIVENSVQFAISGWIIGVILSLMLFIKAGKAPIVNLNIHASTNSRIYNFWQGREINPRIGPLDVKINLFRTAMIAIILVNLSTVVKAIEEAESYSLEHLNVGVLLVALLQIIYSMDALFFESAILTTFEVMYEGTGYMLCTGYMLFPFLPTLTTKYMLYNKTQFSYLFAVPVLFFIMGYLLFRISNSQKNELRKNPLSPSLSHLETIPTDRGRKLIVSGLWGYVRHPNYLGDIIMWWSISSISLTCDILPYYYAIMCTALLIHRAVRDNERCKMRYGLAWEQYTSRVKYMLLYRIF